MSNEHRRLSNYSDKTFEEYREDFHSDDGDTKIKSSPKKSVSKSVRGLFFLLILPYLWVLYNVIVIVIIEQLKFSFNKPYL